MHQEELHYISSPIGTIAITGTKWHITGINFSDQEPYDKPAKLPIIKTCSNQLKEYFAGKRKQFTLPLLLDGSDFQIRVWQELQKIPFGHLISYEDLAIKISNKNFTRVAGRAIGENKLAIVIPCHRVIGKTGNLTGYAGGLPRKQWLIEHEQMYRLKF